MEMATRRIGNLTVHFLGDNASQLERMFDDAYSRSKTFSSDMRETAQTHRNIYVGGSLADLQDKPGFGDAGFNPQSKEVTERAAFGKASGAESFFIVVPGRSHSLIHGGQSYPGSTLLALVHELLHPSQTTRELAETGGLGRDTEARTQMREQGIAAELGMAAGEHFPDVIGSGALYDVQLDNKLPQPNPAPADSVPVAPIGYFGPAHAPSPQPSWREAAGGLEPPRYAAASVAAAEPPNGLVPNSLMDAEGDSNPADGKPVRYLSGRIMGKPEPFGLGAGAPIAPRDSSHENFDSRPTPFNDRSGSSTTVQPGAPRHVAPLVGLVSGKPMSFYPVQPPIWDFSNNSTPNEDADDWLSQLLRSIRSQRSSSGSARH